MHLLKKRQVELAKNLGEQNGLKQFEFTSGLM